MHFKSDWQKSFDSDTFTEDFEKSNGTRTKVEMMYGDFEDLGYLKTNIGAEIVALPFDDQNYDMVLVLPPKSKSTFQN